jgi:hypothetical protein
MRKSPVVQILFSLFPYDQKDDKVFFKRTRKEFHYWKY